MGIRAGIAKGLIEIYGPGPRGNRIFREGCLVFLHYFSVIDKFTMIYIDGLRLPQKEAWEFGVTELKGDEARMVELLWG